MMLYNTVKPVLRGHLLWCYIIVKPVLRGHLLDKEKVVFQDRWPIIFSMTGQKEDYFLIQVTA